MDSGAADAAGASVVVVPLYDASYNIQNDPAVAALRHDPYQTSASLQVYFLVILSAVAFLLVVPSFVWHVRNRNLPAACLTFWALYLNLTNIIHALIWPNDNLATWYWGQGYCDVTVKMQVASPLGVIGAVVCILRALAGVLDTDRMRLANSRAHAIRTTAIETLFCVGLPLLGALLHFVVQSRRYYLYAISGCMYAVADTWVDVLVLWLWPPLLALVAAYYAGLVLVRVVRYRREFGQVLRAASSRSGGGMSRSRFVRLYAIACILLLVYLPVEVYIFVFNITLTPLGPYSWAEVHSSTTWDALVFVPAQGVVFFDRWIHASFGFALFVTLGMGADAAHFWRDSLRALGFASIFPSLALRASATSDVSDPSTASGSGASSTYPPWVSRLGASSQKLIGSVKRGSVKTEESTTTRRSNPSEAFHRRGLSNASATTATATLVAHDAIPLGTIELGTIEEGRAPAAAAPESSHDVV